MQTTFNIRLTLGVIAALAVTTVGLHLLVFLSIQPEALSAAMPSSVVVGPAQGDEPIHLQSSTFSIAARLRPAGFRSD